MKILTVCPESFGANCYLIISNGHALVVDPAPSASAIQRKAEEEKAVIDRIVLTHGHFDHIVSVDTLRKALNVPLMIHKDDAPMLTDGRKNAFFDFYGMDRVYSPAERLLDDKDIISVGDEQITVLHTPGHSPGSICLLCGNAILTGDTLFADSIGRCDLWGGDESKMKLSLEMLRGFPSSTKILPGHGLSASLGSALDNAAYYL